MPSSRRDFLRRALAATFAAAPGFRLLAGEKRLYPGWKPGELDLHFIHTGCGENCFFRLPDGTAVLNDCGDVTWKENLRYIPLLPDDSRCGGEWVSRYIRSMYDGDVIDYAVFSHWHADHGGHNQFGKTHPVELYRARKLSDGRSIDGFECVAEDFRITHHIDHEWPNWGKYKTFDSSFHHVRDWVNAHRAEGLTSVALKPGALNQIALQHEPEKYPEFSVRTICANGRLWDGRKGVVDCAAETLKRDPSFYMNQNILSSAFVYQYGKFRFFTGGDVCGHFLKGAGEKYDYEELVGRMAGKVTVCKSNHHGCADAMSKGFLRHVQAQTYISCIWGPGQVCGDSLYRMTSRAIHPDFEPLVLPTMLPGHHAARWSGQSIMKRIPWQCAQGVHVVVKVFEGGERYRIYLLDAGDEHREVLATFDREA